MKDDKTNEPKEKIKVPLKPYTLKELAQLYKVDKRTLLRWVKELKQDLGKRKGYYYSIAQVKIIFSELLLPSYIEVEQQKITN